MVHRYNITHLHQLNPRKNSYDKKSLRLLQSEIISLTKHYKKTIIN